MMMIGEVARRAGVSVETIRFYERQGLVPEPPRTPAGYRQYPEETVSRLRFIQRAKQLGFSLREIAGLISLRLADDASSPDVCARAVTKLGEIDEKIRDLERMRESVAMLVEACSGSGVMDGCPILVALSTEVGKPNQSTQAKEATLAQRKVEIFTAGCACCDDAVQMVQSIACPSCDVKVLDMMDTDVATRAKELGVRSVPAVAVDGRLAGCCSGRGPTEDALRVAGLGQSV
jgi:MerR family transcriptional regulator, copper efflux regulator